MGKRYGYNGIVRLDTKEFNVTPEKHYAGKKRIWYTR